MSNTATGGHEWLIEFDIEPNNLEEFAAILDKELQSLNSDYEAKRTGNLTLCFPLVKKLPRKTFFNWLKRRGKLGGQNKVPRLSNNRKIVDDISKLLVQEKI